MKKNVYDVSLMAMVLTLLIISSKIVFPISFIPLTLQTLIVFLIPLLFGIKKSCFIFLSYIILGLIGLPIFSNGGGLNYIYQPSFGFIIGFLVISFPIGMIKKETKLWIAYLLIFIGITIFYIIGLTYMTIILNYYLKLNKDFISILKIGFLPFILKDILSIIIAKIIAFRIQPIINIDIK